MNEEVVKSIVQAVHVVYNMSSTPQERFQAQQFLENFKTQNSIDTILPYASYFMKNQQEDTILHFGIHLIDIFITGNRSREWNQIKIEHKMNICEVLFHYVETEMRSILQEKQFIKEKVASLIVGIIEREWPQKITTVFERIFKTAQMGDIQCEVVLLLLKSLAEDLSADFSDTLPTGRKTQVIQELNKNYLAQIFVFFVQLFAAKHTDYIESKKNNDATKFNISQVLIHALLDCIKAFIEDWINIDLLFSTKLVDVLIASLQYDSFKQEAAAGLISVSNLKSKSINATNLVYLLNAIINTFPKIVNFSNLNIMLQEYEFHKKLVKVLSNIGSTHLQFLDAKHFAVIQSVCDLMMNFLSHPSLEIFRELSSIFVVMYKSDSKFTKTIGVQLSTQEFFSKYHSPLLDICSNRSMKEVGNPELVVYENSPVNRFSQMDYDYEEIYLEAFGIARSAARSIIAEIAVLQPMLSLEFAFKALQTVLPKNAPQTGDQLDIFGCVAIKSMTYVMWELASSVFEWVVSAIKFEVKKNPTVAEQFENLFKILQNFSTKDANIQTRYLHLYSYLDPLIIKDNKYLETILQKLIQEMMFRLPSEANKDIMDLSEDTTAARRKAHAILIRICRDFPNAVLLFLNPLVEEAEKLWMSKKILRSELTLMYESFVIISNNMKNYEKQEQFISYLLSNPLKDWQGKDVSQVAASVELLLKSLTIIDELNPQQKEALIGVRSKMIGTLQVFVHVSKRMPDNPQTSEYPQQVDGSYLYPVSSFLLNSIPNILSLIHTLHSIYNPQILNAIPLENRQPLFVGPEEKHFILDSTPASMVTFTEKEKELIRVRRNIRYLRQYSYQVLGFCCKFCDRKQFWYNPQLFDHLSNSIFSNLNYIDTRDLQLLINEFMELFINNCPQELWSTLLLKCLEPFLLIILNRLSEGWAAAIERSKGVFAQSEKDEIVEDFVMKMLTRASLDLFINLTTSLQKPKDGSAAKLSPLIQFLISNENILYLIILLCTRCLNLPDSMSMNRAVTVLHRMISCDKITKNPRFDNLISGEVFQAGIQALLCSKDEDCTTINNFITDIFSIYGLTSKLPSQILKKLPEVTDQKVKQLEEQFLSPLMTADRRRVMRSFFGDLAGSQSGVFKKPQTILNIPIVHQQRGQSNDMLVANKQVSYLDNLQVDLNTLFK